METPILPTVCLLIVASQAGAIIPAKIPGIPQSNVPEAQPAVDTVEDGDISAMRKSLTVLVGQRVVDLGDADAGKGPVPAKTLLHDRYGIEVEDVLPAGSSLMVVDNKDFYGGTAARPSEGVNLAMQLPDAGGQVDQTKGPLSYVLHFPCALAEVTISRPQIIGGATHPAWKAIALDADHKELASKQEGLLSKASPGGYEAAARASNVTLSARGIMYLKIVSDGRDSSGRPFAATSTMLLERLVLDDGNPNTAVACR